jgi:integrase
MVLFSKLKHFMKHFSKTQSPNLIRHDNGTYYAQTRTGQGRQSARSLQTKVISVARLKLPRALAALRAGADRPLADPTIGECLDAYLERKRIQGHKGKPLKPRSLAYREETALALRKTWPALDKMKAAFTTPGDCLAWADRARPKYSGTRFNGMVETLRGAFDYGIETGVLEKNPALTVHRASVKPKDRFIPNREQFTRILLALDQRPERQFATLSVRGLAFTGLRPNEARHVEPSDIDLKARTLRARETKNGDPRTIHLIDQAVELFEADTDKVLTAFKKSPRKALRNVCRELELPLITPYTFRHLYLNSLIESGMDIAAAALEAGHRDKGRTLLGSYSHPRAENVQRQLKNVRI